MASQADFDEYLATLENHAKTLSDLEWGLKQLYRLSHRLVEIEAKLPPSPEEGAGGRSFEKAGRAVVASVIDDQLAPAIAAIKMAMKTLATELSNVRGVTAGGLADADVASACAESRRVSAVVRNLLAQVSESFLKDAGDRLVAVAELPGHAGDEEEEPTVH